MSNSARLKIVFWEFILLFASVLFFRSTWMILDRISAMKEEFETWTLLILGMVVALTAMFMIHKQAEKRG